MAVVRPARSSPPYALIIFIFLFFVATGLAVWAFIGQSKANEEAAKAQAIASNFASIDDQRDPAFNVSLGEAKVKTAGGAKLSIYKQLTTKITDLQKEVNQLNTSVSDAQTKLAAAEERANNAAASLKSAQTEYASTVKKLESSNEAKAKSVDERTTELNRIQSELTKVRNDLDATVKKYEADKTAASADFEKKLRELADKIKATQDEVDKRDQRIALLLKEREMNRPNLTPSALKEASGKIIRASMGSNEVWVNVGRRDHATPGLTFAVFDPTLGVGSGPDAAGKGAIELTQVGENESLARVTNLQKGQSLSNNDLIANFAFNHDKNRKFRFVVYGDFDLDGDGVPTPAEREKIVRLVQSWGGVVEDKVTPQTDYLVVGAPPGSATAKFDALNEQAEDLKTKRKAQQDEYTRLVAEAHDYSIPVLNANRFLGMIGYYNQTIVKK